MSKVQSRSSLEPHNLPPEILRVNEQVARNTLQYMKTLSTLRVQKPSIEEFAKQSWPSDAIVLARGPSFFREKYLDSLREARESHHRFLLLCSDGTLAHCLEKGLVPDITVTVDPSVRILRWFGDPEGLTAHDDYFLKDRDSPKESKTMIDPERTIELLNEYGSRLSVAVDVFTHQKVFDRLVDIGAKIFLYFPMSDDEEYMKDMWKRYPDLISLSCGGNVGTAAYNLGRFIGVSRICLCGFDFGYPPGTPLDQTQYFDIISQHGKLADQMFLTVTNPNLDNAWFTDRVYLGYANTLLRMVKDAASHGVETVNATKGGILFGPELKWGDLWAFLESTPKKS
jgi:hypothetical protein